MCEEMNSLAASIRSSQSELKANSCSLASAMHALTEYAQNPTSHKVFGKTMCVLNEAIEIAEEH